MKNKTLKRSLCAFLAVLMIFGTLTVGAIAVESEEIALQSRHPFIDVAQNAWYNNAVQFVWDRGIMVGTSSTQFSPNATLTRSMLATIIYRVAGEPQTAFRQIFSDVPSGRWYSVPVTWANDADIVRGVGGGRFAPDDRLTIEQLSAMMHRYAVSRGYNVSVPADMHTPWGTSAWATNYVRWAAHNGFISTSAYPAGHASRAETAQFIYLFVNQTLPPLPTLPNRRLTEQERADWIAVYQARGGPTAFELEVIWLVNIERANHGVGQVEIDETLMMAARFYAQTMTQWGQLGHNVGPYANDPGARAGASANVARAFGAPLQSWNGGNGIGGSRFAEDMVRAWMNSEGHRRFMLSPGHTVVGFGQFGSGGMGYLFMNSVPSGHHRVNFFLNGGQPYVPEQLVRHGERAVMPTTIPVWPGFEFMGWNWDFDDPITSSITISAQWRRN